MWIYTQGELVMATNPNDMTGNSGWIYVENTQILNGYDLFSIHGVPLFKIVNGEIVGRSLEEIEADTPAPQESVADLTDTDIEEILADHEYRICLMELGVSEEELV